MIHVSSAIPHLTRLRFLKSHIYRSITVTTAGKGEDKQYPKFELNRFSQLQGIRLKPSSPIFERDENSSNADFAKQKIVPFLLADIGEGIADVEVLQWFVSPGDTVKQFDRVCEVQSDKATVEITSRYDGVIESLSTHDDIVKVGSPLMHIIVEDDNQEGAGGFDSANDIPNNTRTYNDKMEEDNPPMTMKPIPPLPSGTSSSPKILATPAVRKLILDNDIDFNSISGSGPNGLVLKTDVLKILGNVENHEIESLEQKKLQTKDASFHLLNSANDEAISIRGYHRIMVKTMEESLSIPHMCYADEINMDEILKVRETLGEVRPSILPFTIKAASLSIQEFPILNSSIDVDKMTIKYHSSHNVGVAMDSSRGLVVPVVKGCQNLSILEIAEELIRLKEAALSGNITENETTGATFSLSNIGAIGGTYMSPIVTSPQVAIGAIGRIQRLPRFVSSDSLKVKETSIMKVSWAADHRAIDGATLARFSNKWKILVENPTSMLVSMR